MREWACTWLQFGDKTYESMLILLLFAFQNAFVFQTNSTAILSPHHDRKPNVPCVFDLDLADLPLVKFDFSCNKVSTIPVCYRKMTQLQSLQLENNPLQSPPAQVTLSHTHTHVLYISCLTAAADMNSYAFRSA